MRSRYTLVTPEKGVPVEDYAPGAQVDLRPPENPFRLRFLSGGFRFMGFVSGLGVLGQALAAVTHPGVMNTPTPINFATQIAVLAAGSWTSFRTANLLRDRRREGGYMAVTYYGLVAGEMLLRGQGVHIVSSLGIGALLLASVWDLLE